MADSQDDFSGPQTGTHESRREGWRPTLPPDTKKKILAQLKRDELEERRLNDLPEILASACFDFAKAKGAVSPEATLASEMTVGRFLEEAAANVRRELDAQLNEELSESSRQRAIAAFLRFAESYGPHGRRGRKHENQERDKWIFHLRQERYSWGELAKVCRLPRETVQAAWRREDKRRAELRQTLADLRTVLQKLGVPISPEAWPQA